MALVKGTNCGFVTVAPTVDPDGDTTSMDNNARAQKDTSPATATKITEVGWWCDDATEEVNFEVGLYSHDAGNDDPNLLLEVSRTNAKGTDTGWKTATVDWDISSSTIYWIAVQLDDTTITTDTNRTAATGERRALKYTGQTTLADDWGASTNILVRLNSIYAVVEVGAPPATNMKINISDVWKDVDSMKINIGDVWKDVVNVWQNIGDEWKVVY